MKPALPAIRTSGRDVQYCCPDRGASLCWARDAAVFTMYMVASSLCMNPDNAVAEEPNRPIQVAAVDTQNGPPPCGQDGICNIAACPQDPDCPVSLPDNTAQSTGSYSSRRSDIHDCTSQEVTEIAHAMDWGAEHWSQYEAALEDIRDWPVNIGNCLEDRFKRNGVVVCEATMGGSCTSNDGPNNGWASFANKRCHMCPDFLKGVRALGGDANRKACYFALITHEWGHTCERGHKTLEIIDDEAFKFWKSQHPNVTINFDDCGMR